jgi:DNA-binding SARP family transcriptional activator
MPRTQRSRWPAAKVASSQGGYLLHAKPEQLDLCRFRRLVAAAGAAAGDQHAAALLQAALELWRGPALARLESPWLRGMRDTLEAERCRVAMDLNDIRLRRGEHGALAGELTWQVAASPTDERLIGQLMLALYRSGRQAEALRWFARTRQRLAGEFGADPGPRLQALHQRMLRADPSLDAASPGGAGRRTRVRETCCRSRRTRPSAVLACRGRRP